MYYDTLIRSDILSNVIQILRFLKKYYKADILILLFCVFRPLHIKFDRDNAKSLDYIVNPFSIRW